MSIPLTRVRGTAADSDELRFVQRVYRLRVLGLGLGACAVAAAFHEVGAAPLSWAGMLAHGLLWPHLAAWRSRRAAHPQQAEFQNLVVDSALGGVWIAYMHFMLLPSMLLATMLSMDKLAVGGWRFLARTATAQFTCAAIIGVLLGFPLALQSSLAVVIGCLPLLVIYPLAVSSTTHRLVHKVREQNRQLAAQSRYDAQTGLLSRSHWEDAVEVELERMHRHGGTASLLMIDIDLFKNINDRHGPAAGDQVVRGVAAIVRDSVRIVDVVGRYGGDEFAVILIGTPLAGALQVAERIRHRVIETSFADVLKASCTVSIGAAQLDGATHNTRAWVRQADAALYQAKTHGRNCASAIATPIAA